MPKNADSALLHFGSLEGIQREMQHRQTKCLQSFAFSSVLVVAYQFVEYYQNQYNKLIYKSVQLKDNMLFKKVVH